MLRSEREILVSLYGLEFCRIVVCEVGSEGICGHICRCGVISARIYKHYLVSHNVGKGSLLALIVGILTVLDASHNADSRALAEELGYELSGCTPSGNVEEIRFSLLIILTCEFAVDRNREGNYRNAGRRLLEFGISGKTAAENDLVKVEI